VAATRTTVLVTVPERLPR